MKIVLNFLIILSCFLFTLSCSDSESKSIEPIDQIEFRTIGFKVTPDNSITIELLDSIYINLVFEITTLGEETYASRVHPIDGTVQILDNSTYGYPDALELDSIINDEQNWIPSLNYVLGTSVGNAGLFEGSGLRYLGFRIVNGSEYQYGWVSIINNEGNTCVEIKEYAVNLTTGRSILAGQVD